DFIENGNIHNSVNFPDVRLARGTPHRVALANSNVPNMLGQISTAMARAGLNIHDMINQSRESLAFTIVDTDSPVSPETLAGLQSIDGVLCARVID
ncbi:MAG: 3-phosphoglycerate dehydrogenase, partial [Proteobacteria bacterium]|nr:3-phosphoglycerate dehydrogenase [Pseudomonadota bacterium]